MYYKLVKLIVTTNFLLGVTYISNLPTVSVKLKQAGG